MSEKAFNVISRADQGQLLEDLNEEMDRLTAAVLKTGLKGKLTLTISVGKMKGNNNAVEVKTDLSAKLPQPIRTADLYFADEDGVLSRKDPRQPDLPGTTNVAPIRNN